MSRIGGPLHPFDRVQLATVRICTSPTGPSLAVSQQPLVDTGWTNYDSFPGQTPPGNLILQVPARNAGSVSHLEEHVFLFCQDLAAFGGEQGVQDGQVVGQKDY